MSPLTLLLLSPVLAIALIIFKAPAKTMALLVSVVNLLITLFVFAGYHPGLTTPTGFQFEQNMVWVSGQQFGLPDIHYHVGVDGINLPLLLLTAIVSLAAVAVTPATVKRASEYFIYILLISLGAFGAFASLDLFSLYIFHEFALIPTFLLMGIWGFHNRQYLATQLTIYLTLGSLILLAGIVGFVLALPTQSRSFDLVDLKNTLTTFHLADVSQGMIYGLMLVGFGILISLFPFHSWAPQGYATSPSAAAMLHAGVLKKFGLYGLIRVTIPFLPHAFQDPFWDHFLVILLLGNILYVGYVTVAQKELNTMLGYSSVMHMGYIFLGLLAWNVIGVSGAILLMVGHGLSAALLFGLAGEVREKTGESRLAELGGLAQKAPFLSVCFVIASMASVGMPGLANFSGEVLVFFGAFHDHSFVTILALWGVVVSAIYQLRAVRAVFFGPLKEKFANLTDLTTIGERWPYLMLIIGLLILGFKPGILLDMIQPSVKYLLGA